MSAAVRNFNGPPSQLTVGACPTCGKATYLTRKEAKRAARGMFPGTHHRPVKCGDLWHIQLIRPTPAHSPKEGPK